MQIGLNLSLTLEHGGAGAPTLDMTFTGTGNALDSRITFTRASTGTYFDSAGVLTSAANNVARFDYNPATLAARGLLIEEQRTNSIRNNTMQGAVAGTPGTLPTNWSVFTALTGLTREVVGTGTENGITYIDIRVSGTPSGAGVYGIYTETSTGVAALNGQTWTNSGYFKLQAGSLTGITSVRLYFQENNSSGSYLTEQNSAITTPTNAALNTQRSSATRTLTQATTAFLMPGFNLLLSGAAIDITLRIGLPQLEQGAFATSVIPTTTTALTRSADVASVNTLSPWFNATEGTLFFEMAEAFVGSTANDAYINFSNGTANNVIGVFQAGVGATPQMRVIDGGVNQAGPFAGNITANVVFKIANAYKQDDFAMALNGVQTANSTDTSGTVPSVSRLNFNGPTGNTILAKWLRRITYYPRRLTNAELQAITA